MLLAPWILSLYSVGYEEKIDTYRSNTSKSIKDLVTKCLNYLNLMANRIICCFDIVKGRFFSFYDLRENLFFGHYSSTISRDAQDEIISLTLQRNPLFFFLVFLRKYYSMNGIIN